jgi:hypothetical protein
LYNWWILSENNYLCFVIVSLRQPIIIKQNENSSYQAYRIPRWNKPYYIYISILYCDMKWLNNIISNNNIHSNIIQIQIWHILLPFKVSEWYKGEMSANYKPMECMGGQKTYHWWLPLFELSLPYNFPPGCLPSTSVQLWFVLHWSYGIWNQNHLGSHDATPNSLLLLTMLFLKLAQVLNPHPSSLPVKDEYHLLQCARN